MTVELIVLVNVLDSLWNRAVTVAVNVVVVFVKRGGSLPKYVSPLEGLVGCKGLVDRDWLVLLLYLPVMAKELVVLVWTVRPA